MLSARERSLSVERSRERSLHAAKRIAEAFVELPPKPEAKGMFF